MESTLEIANMWTLKEARVLINALQPHARTFGFHVCLGGGVLNQGLSKKDVDLYFLPLDNGKVEASSVKLMAFLEETWGKSAPMITGKNHFESIISPDGRRQLALVENKTDYPEGKDSIYSVKRKFAYSGLRVDVFILGGGTLPQTAEVVPTRVVTPPPLENEAGFFTAAPPVTNAARAFAYSDIATITNSSMWGDSPFLDLPTNGRG